LSLKCYDTIRDRSSIISLLFQRHNFINLQSCQFISVNPSAELDNVIKQVESLNRLVSFSIIQPSTVNTNEKNQSDITRTVFMSKSSSLRSVMLRYNYAYLDLSTYTSIAPNLISLDLLISGSPNTVSVYSILPILRVCHRIRYLHTIIKHEIPSENNNVNISIQEAFINENDLPISPQVTSFDLSIFTTCDTRSIAYILRCLPNLLHFKFFHESPEVVCPSSYDLVNGYTWQYMFEMHVPFLSKFDFHISILKEHPNLDLDVVVNSFQYFVQKYPEWQMVIDRWGPDAKNPLEYVMLRTIGYHQYKRNLQINIPLINYELFETRSTRTTTTTTNDHYLYYSDIKILKLNMTKITPKTARSFPLFQHINSLVIDMRTKHSSWDKSLSFVNWVQSNDNDDEQQYVAYLSNIVHLSNVTKINFETNVDPSGSADIKACPNVIDLKISPLYLYLASIIDNPSLISIFKQIKILNLITKYSNVCSDLVSNLVKRFPSLTHMEVRVASFNYFESAIDILLSHQQNLSYLNIGHSTPAIFNQPFSRSHIIDKRRQAFGFNTIDEHKVTVNRNERSVEIRLS
ncbi:unnamed protein product, partial [Rotaria socialis]